MIKSFFKENRATIISAMVTLIASGVSICKNAKINTAIFNVVIIIIFYIFEHTCEISIEFKDKHNSFLDNIKEIPFDLSKGKKRDLEIIVNLKKYKKWLNRFHHLKIAIPKGVTVIPTSKKIYDYMDEDKNELRIPLSYLENGKTKFSLALSAEVEYKEGMEGKIECKTTFVFNHLNQKNEVLVKWE